MTEWIKKAFVELYPDRVCSYTFNIKYSNRFKGYNANVKYTWYEMSFHLSKNLRQVDEDIKIGLIQSLLLKCFPTKKAKTNQTFNLDLYNNFLKNIHIAIPKNKIDPILKQSFDKVNELYCSGLIDIPNLVWGQHSTRKLGSYEYSSDEIIISSVLKQAPVELLDYVMYHELLHKKHKFNHKNGRSHHHTPAFRKEEAKFRNFPIMEKQLTSFLRNRKIKNFFFG